MKRMTAKKNAPAKRLSEELRKVATVRAYVKAMAEKGVIVRVVEWAPADPMKRNSKNTEKIDCARYAVEVKPVTEEM
jgi:hypothetical protein